MQQSFKKIQQLTCSEHSIFNLSPIDYPSQFQQSFYSSYIALLHVLQKPHQQILHYLSNQSQKNFQQISQGFLYLFLLDRKNIDKYSQYTVILRIEIWNYIAYYLEILWTDYSDVLKPAAKSNGIAVFGLTGGLGIWAPDMAVLITNSLNFYEATPEAKQLIQQLLLFWVGKLEEGVEFEGEMVTVICHYIFPKAIKLSPFIYQKQCLKLISIIRQKYFEKICQISQQLLYILESPLILKIPELLSLHTALSSQASCQLVSLPVIEQIVFSYLPRRLQVVLQYIFKHNIKQNELMYHFVWLEKFWNNRKVIFGEVLVDLARWAALSNNNIEIKMWILEWVCKKCLSLSNQIFQRTKRALFFPWFLSIESQITPTSSPSNIAFTLTSTLPTLLLLRNYLSTEPRVSIQFLKHLLSLRSQQQYQQRMSYIFNEWIKCNHFRIQFVVENRFVPVHFQQEFINLLRDARENREKIGEDLKFDPEQQLKGRDLPEGPKEKEAVQQLRYEHEDNAAEVNYTSEGYGVNSSVSVNPFSMVDIQSEQIAQISLQEQFVDEFTTLENMLDNPTYQTFVSFFKQFSRVGTQISTKNKPFVPTFLTQTSKLLYCVYNNQFENPSSSVPEQSIISLIIRVLLREWHQVTHRIILIKNLVKKMFELFPMSEIAFWYHCFMYFEPSILNYRDFRTWVVGNKGDLVLKAVEAVVGPDGRFRKQYFKVNRGK